MSLPLVYLVQRDFVVGDIDGNCQMLLQSATRAHQAGAVAMLSPELSLCGYCPEDMLLDDSFMNAVEKAFEQFLAVAPPLPIIIGLPHRNADKTKLYNASALVCEGKVTGLYKKEALPNESVFDEQRYFTPGDNAPLIFCAGGVTFAVQICADIWHLARAAKVAKTAADYILSPNGSPFYVGKHPKRIAAAAEFAKQSGAGIFYCNTVGGQDELIYDGASFVMDKNTVVQRQLPAMESYEGFGDEFENNAQAAYPSDNWAMYAAIKMGIRDYFTKSGFADGVALGLSGGVDSALTAVAAADALGGDKVLAVMMPSRYTSDASIEDATLLAKNLNLELLTISIDPLMDAIYGAITPHLRPRPNDATLENVQARLRGQILMALSNNRNLLLLSTGNKSEIACGYATLYGDMCGGYAPLSDVSKTRVWELATARNESGEVIPPRVISRPPSAELRDNQTDQQTLPPYAQIDDAISMHIENGASVNEVENALGGEFAAKFFNLLANGEHKRRQSAIGPKLTARAFGRDWRMPVANRYRHYHQ